MTGSPEIGRGEERFSLKLASVEEVVDAKSDGAGYPFSGSAKLLLDAANHQMGPHTLVVGGLLQAMRG